MNSSNDIGLWDLKIKVMEAGDDGFPKESILQKNLISLFDLSDKQIDLLWSHSDANLCQYFHFEDDVWLRLNEELIYRDDPIPTIMAVSLGRLYKFFETDDSFYALLSYFRHYMRHVLGNKEFRLNYSDASSSKIISDNDIEAFADLNISLFYLHGISMSSLATLNIRTFHDTANISERMILERLGLCKDSLLLTESLWRIREYASSIDKIYKQMHAKKLSDEFNTFYEYIAAILKARKVQKKEYHRNIEIALSYLLNIDGNESPNKLGDEKRIVLEDIALKFSMTRERVRQIVLSIEKRLTDKRTFVLMSGFWLLIYNTICNNDGIINIKVLGDEIRKTLNWKAALGLDLLFRLISKNSYLEYIPQIKGIYLKGWPCADCDIFTNKLLEILDYDRPSSFVKPINEKLKNACLRECPRTDMPFKPNLKELCRFKLCAMPNKAVYEGESIYRSSDWNLKHGLRFSPTIGLIELL